MGRVDLVRGKPGDYCPQITRDGEDAGCFGHRVYCEQDHGIGARRPLSFARAPIAIVQSHYKNGDTLGATPGFGQRESSGSGKNIWAQSAFSLLPGSKVGKAKQAARRGGRKMGKRIRERDQHQRDRDKDRQGDPREPPVVLYECGEFEARHTYVGVSVNIGVSVGVSGVGVSVGVGGWTVSVGVSVTPTVFVGAGVSLGGMPVNVGVDEKIGAEVDVKMGVCVALGMGDGVSVGPMHIS